MALADYIARVFGKKPVWLYIITVGSQTFHLTSKALGITTGVNRPSTDYPTGQQFMASSIRRGEIIESTQPNRVDTWVRLATMEPAIQAVLDRGEQDRASIEIWQGYLGDPDEEYIRRYIGRIVSIQPTLLLTTLNCEPAITEMARSSVAQVMQRPCRHAHYFTDADGGGCRLTLADFQQSAICSAASGVDITVDLAAAQPAGAFLAGIVEYNGVEYMIENHDGSGLKLEVEIPGLADDIAAAAAADPVETVSVLIAEGCNLTSERCAQFGNIVNFGGFRWMLDTPFDGRSIA